MATRYSNLMTAVATRNRKRNPASVGEPAWRRSSNPPQAGPPDFPESKFYNIRSEVKGSLWCQRPRDVTGGSARGRRRRATTALPFGLAEIDARLPAGGLALGALHEVAGGGNGAINGAAAALFIAGIAARTRGKVLWCLDRPGLFAPALAQADLKSDRSSISKAAKRRRSSIALRKVCVVSGWTRSLRRSHAFR